MKGRNLAPRKGYFLDLGAETPLHSVKIHRTIHLRLVPFSYNSIKSSQHFKTPRSQETSWGGGG